MWIESFPGRALREAWLYLTPEEARELRDALTGWAAEAADREWQTQLADDDRGLTIVVGPHVGAEDFARRFNSP